MGSTEWNRQYSDRCKERMMAHDDDDEPPPAPTFQVPGIIDVSEMWGMMMTTPTGHIPLRNILIYVQTPVIFHLRCISRRFAELLLSVLIDLDLADNTDITRVGLLEGCCNLQSLYLTRCSSLSGNIETERESDACTDGVSADRHALLFVTWCRPGDLLGLLQAMSTLTNLNFSGCENLVGNYSRLQAATNYRSPNLVDYGRLILQAPWNPSKCSDNSCIFAAPTAST